MLKDKLAFLLAIVLLITLVPVNLGLAAQDYNSSRSNKPSPIMEDDQDENEISTDVQKSVFQVKLKIGEKLAKIGETEKNLDVAPFIEDGRTMVPFRFIGEELGAEISWEPIQKKVSYKLNEIEVELWIDKNIASVNGLEVFIDSENLSIIPKLKDGRTFVPIRFIVEALGFDVEWKEDSKEVVVAAAPAQDYNSSRSNKPAPSALAPKDDGIDSELMDDVAALAQDYNSSRSNKPAPSALKEINDENTDKNPNLEINWIEFERKAIYKFKETSVEILVDKKIVIVNGTEVNISGKQATIILTGKFDPALGPINFISEISGYIIEWNPKVKELSIKQL